MQQIGKTNFPKISLAAYIFLLTFLSLHFSPYIHSRAPLQTFYVSKPCILSIYIYVGPRACPSAKTLLH
jgi:hypothetical protein